MKPLPPDIDPDGLKHDWELLDRYQSFSSELLRLSLAGIAAVGFLITASPGTERLLRLAVPAVTRWGIGTTLVALGLSAAAALGHRFVSSDSMACHISLLRMQLRDRSHEDVAIEKTTRDRRFKQSGALLLLSSGLLGVGALALAITFITML